MSYDDVANDAAKTSRYHRDCDASGPEVRGKYFRDEAVECRVTAAYNTAEHGRHYQVMILSRHEVQRQRTQPRRESTKYCNPESEFVRAFYITPIKDWSTRGEGLLEIIYCDKDLNKNVQIVNLSIDALIGFNLPTWIVQSFVNNSTVKHAISKEM